MSGGSDPLKTAAGEDAGSETLRRYRYQAAYAAWLAISALNGVPEAVAVYCEHHDDVLLEFDDGRCDAIQVKSQSDGAGPLKGTAEPVLTSLRRFAVLEHKFGPRFRRYRLATIAGFYRAAKSSSNLGHCLEQAQACAPESTPDAPLSILVRRIKAPPEVSTETVVGALKKVQLDHSLPKLGDMETRVREAVESLEGVGQYRASDLLDAALAIIDLAFAAGAATQESSSANYVAYLEDPASHATNAAIKAKRLALEDIRVVIREAAEKAVLLRSKEGSDITKLPATSGVALRKLDAGGVSVHTAGILEDLRSSAELEISDRLYRDGAEIANADYDHLKVLVETLAEDARLEAASASKDDYGPAMYLALRKRLKAQGDATPASTRGFSTEQLTGMAMILTELCKVWWSEPFALEPDGG
jgi:Cap4 dsDNA endonuclease